MGVAWKSDPSMLGLLYMLCDNMGWLIFLCIIIKLRYDLGRKHCSEYDQYGCAMTRMLAMTVIFPDFGHVSSEFGRPLFSKTASQ